MFISFTFYFHSLDINLYIPSHHMPYGQIVLGPPGSGKTTYCHGVSQYLTSLGRKVAIVNLDPANDTLPYQCDINICDLITLEDVMTEMHLGPNGAFIYALDFLRENINWLIDGLTKLGAFLLLITFA